MNNFKRITAAFAAVFAIFCVCAFSACKKAPSSEYVKFKEIGGDRQAYYVSGYWDGMIANGNVLIPETYEGLPVTEIGSRAFKDCTLIKTLIVGDNVYTIGNYAFENCKNLKSVTFGKKLETLTHNTFTDCKSLKTINFGNVREIEERAFENCTALSSLTFSESVSRIDNYVFRGCTNLKTIEFKNAQMDNGINGLAGLAFSGCPNLENITFPDGAYPLYSKNNCIINAEDKALIIGGKGGQIPADGSITAINSYAFQGRAGSEVTIPEDITYINGFAFEDCQIAKIILPENSVWRLKSEFSKNPVTIDTSLPHMTPENVAKHMFEIYPHYSWTRIDIPE